MKSRATAGFWAAYNELPSEVRNAAQKAYRLFRDNPSTTASSSRRFTTGNPSTSVRVTGAYRAVGLLENDEVTWFWIGSHAAYDRLLKRL